MHTYTFVAADAIIKSSREIISVLIIWRIYSTQLRFFEPRIVEIICTFPEREEA